MLIPISIGIYQDMGGGDPLIVCNPGNAPLAEVIALVEHTANRLRANLPPAGNVEGTTHDTEQTGPADPGLAAAAAGPVPDPAGDPDENVEPGESVSGSTNSGIDPGV